MKIKLMRIIQKINSKVLPNTDFIINEILYKLFYFILSFINLKKLIITIKDKYYSNLFFIIINLSIKKNKNLTS